MPEKKRILIVDDDTEIRDLLEFDISSSGYFTDTASDGMEGLNKALNNKYDLILLDVMIPKMNGFELLKKSAEKDNNWFVNFHIGVCYMERFNMTNAKAYFEISNNIEANPWATYGLACIAKNSDKEDLYFELLEKAYKLNPLCPQLLHELCHDLFDAEKYEKMDELLTNMDPSLIEFERIKLDVIKNALKKNDFDTIDKYIDYNFATNREGEILLSEGWFEMMSRKRAIKAGVEYTDDLKKEFIKLHDEGKVEEWEKLPYKFDFRMVTGDDFYAPPTER